MNDNINKNSMAMRLIKAQYDLEQMVFKDESYANCCTHKQCFCISEAEFSLIWNYIKKELSNEEVLKIINESKSQWENIKKNDEHTAEMLEGIITLEELLKMHETALPFSCVFYNSEKKSCSIYDVRPLICRAYGGESLSDPRKKIIRQYNIKCFLEKVISFLFLKNDSGYVLIRRPAPIFYYFSMILRNTEPGVIPKIEFCDDILNLSEVDYIKKLINSTGNI